LNTSSDSSTKKPLELLLFLEELDVVRQLSQHTIKAYDQDLLKLYLCFEEFDLQIHQVQAHHIRNWVGKLHGQGLSARSIARLLSAWRTFFDWIKKPHPKLPTIQITNNPVVDIKAPRKAKSLPKALSVEHTQVLMECAKKQRDLADLSIDHNWAVVRDYAIVELLYSSGLRLSELLSIDVRITGARQDDRQSWIDWETAEVNVFGKGGKRRIVPVGNMAMQALNSWRTAWGKKMPDLFGPFFINEKGARLSPRTVQMRLQKLAVSAGLPTHVHPHMLRHSFASHVLQSSHDLRAVQEMLGHVSIGSTQIYTSLDFQHLAQAYDQAHPRAKPEKS
jgi:integrase/recombinase XerC